MARKKTRSVADIVMDITVAEMSSNRTDAFHVSAPRPNGDIQITGGDWTVTVHANGTHTATGDVPTRILAQL